MIVDFGGGTDVEVVGVGVGGEVGGGAEDEARVEGQG